MIDAKTQGRLIVLIPDSLACQAGLAHQIHWMADREGMAVLFLVLATRGAQALDTQRSVATLKAVTSASRLEVESKLVTTGDCLETLRAIASPEDQIAVIDEQAAGGGLFQVMPVDDFLSTQAINPALHRAGVYAAPPRRTPPWLYHTLAMAGFLIIIAAFTWLEVTLDLALAGTAQKIVLLGLFSVELGAIAAWNRIVAR
jgi:hypothetical protein